jgi:hypothetical protein
LGGHGGGKRGQREETKARQRAQARRARERAERRDAANRALRRRRVLAAAVMVFVGLLAVPIALVLGNDDPSTVSGNLSGIRDISFIDGTHPLEGISPVCGCMHPPVNAWRGVTFAGRQLTLARSGSAPWTEWVLSSADPGPLSPVGGQNWVQVDAIRLRPRGAFNPRWLLGGVAQHAQIVGRSTFSAYDFELMTRGSLHVAMLGPVPVGAWVPFPGSRVVLSPQPSQFPQDAGVPVLTEHYPSTLGYDNGKGENDQAYPLGDFLGPNLVLWSDDPSAQMPETPLSTPTRPGVITALLIRKSTFSMRVTVVPLTNSEFRDAGNEHAKYPNPRQPAAFFGTSDQGEVSLTLNQPLSAAAYGEMRQRVVAHPTTSIKALADPDVAAPYGAPVPAPPPGCFSSSPPPTTLKTPPPADCTPTPWRYDEQERYPPLPMYAGFNVFGPLNAIVFRNVGGHLSVGDRPIDLSGAPDLALGGVNGLRNSDDQELLSAPLATSQQSAELKFRAVASVRVNGVLETSWLQQHRTAVAIAGVIVAILGLAFGILAFIQGMQLWDPKARRA